MMNYYEALGVSTSASQEDIQKAFRTMAKRYHPDAYSGRNEHEMKRRQTQFILITQAYEMLKDSQKRHAYDVKLNLHSKKNQTKSSFDQQNFHFKGFEQNSHAFNDFEKNYTPFETEDLSDLFQDAEDLLGKLGVDPRPKFEQLLDWALAVFHSFIKDEEPFYENKYSSGKNSKKSNFGDEIEKEFSHLKQKYF